MGARWNNPVMIASGGFSIVVWRRFSLGRILAISLLLRRMKILREGSMRRLDVSLKSIRRFWIFLSIVLIVLIVNALVSQFGSFPLS